MTCSVNRNRRKLCYIENIRVAGSHEGWTGSSGDNSVDHSHYRERRYLVVLFWIVFFRPQPVPTSHNLRCANSAISLEALDCPNGKAARPKRFGATIYASDLELMNLGFYGET